MREVLLLCAAAGRGTPVRGRHRQRIVCGADHDLRYGVFCRVDAEFGGITGEAVLRIGDMQRPGLRTAHSGGALEIRDVLAARTCELAVKEAFADVAILRPYSHLGINRIANIT